MNAAPTHTRERADGWLAAALLIATAVAMAALSWRSWPDPFVDFGRELFVAWRLSEGDLLYRDLVYLNGPLSPYWNALWFRVLGPGIDSLALVNFALLGLLTAALYDLSKRTSGPLAATLAGFVLLSVFGFAQLVRTGNYNFIAPYSHEITHGMLLSVASLWCLDAWARTGRRSLAAASGLALGAVFLTKPELFIALSLALAASLLALRGRPDERLPIAAIAASSFVPPLLAAALLAGALPAEDALRGVAGSWHGLLTSNVANMAYYRSGMGTNDISQSLAWLVKATGGWCLALAPAALAAWLGGGPLRGRAWLPAATFALSLAAMIAAWGAIDWFALARPLPLLVGGLALWLARRLRHAGNGGADATGGNAERTTELALALGLVVFAGTLLAKMLFNVRINHYGFALAMPATLVAVSILTGGLPAWLTRRGFDGASFRAGALGVVLACVAGYVQISSHFFASRSLEVGAPPDAIRVDPARGEILAEALAAIERRAGPGDTLVVMPEGAMLNYLARRPSSIPHIVFTPFEFLVFGEEEIFGALRGSPPEFIALVHRNTAEFGARFFGKHYGEPMYRWIRRNYRPVEKLGKTPLQALDRFGILLLARSADRDGS